VHDNYDGLGFLLVLDAGTFAELARVSLPHAVPAMLHGAFWADDALQLAAAHRARTPPAAA
jgi:carotenoid cleavage dioxygenase-like enzyme